VSAIDLALLLGGMRDPIPTAGLPLPWGPPFPDEYTPAIRAALAMDAARAARLVELLPESVRAILALGPVSQVVVPGEAKTTGCRLCDAKNRMIELEDAGRVKGKQARAIVRLHEWHAAVDLLAFNPFLPINEGPVSFARCLAIYRAAGWDG
jgi:hypothetical protein